MNAFPTRKLKYLVSPQSLKMPYEASERSYIGLENIQSWTGRLLNDAPTEPEGTVSLFETGDVLFGKLRPYLAKVLLADFSGACSTEALVLRAGPLYWPPFLKYVLSEKRFINEVDASTFGAKMPRASWDFIGSRQVPLPDLEAQEVVAAFLDRDTARIDQLIVMRQRQAEVLAEREDATFIGIVTGADRKGPKKGSGVEWIGDIPPHWQAPKFTHVARQETGHTPSRQEDTYWVPGECVIPWFSLADVWQIRSGGQIYVSETAEKISQIGMKNSAARLLPAGTVILSRTASVGFAAVLSVPMATTQDFVGWICGERVRPEFLYYVLRAMKPEFRRLMMGSTHQTIYMPDIRSFHTPLPPLDEQAEIVDRLDSTTARFRASVLKIMQSIEKLKEYRAVLVTAAVTGEIKVNERSLAVAKPDRARFRVIIAAEIVQRHQGTPKFGRVKLQKELYLAEAHVGIKEIQGAYLREAAGPFDWSLIQEIERGMEASAFFRKTLPDIRIKSAGVTYAPLAKAGQHRTELTSLLGHRTQALHTMIDLLRDFDTLAVEAIATLFAAWNDALIDGQKPDDNAIIRAVLNEWHPEKREKFKDADLRHWLDWMRRNSFVPSGNGPRTRSTRTRDLFAS